MRRPRSHFLRSIAIVLLTMVAAQVQARPTVQQDQGIAPTYTIFATRQGTVGDSTANGHIVQPRDRFVALPSPSVLCSYMGNEYQVRITYKGRSVVAPVWDVGPWNTNDDYWNPNREGYPDLPVGVPMAQAAYLEGYNNGLDSFGRLITNPNGIDIGDGTFWDDLGMTRNDWVQVSFLWLGSDPGPGNAANVVPPPTQGPQDLPVPGPVANPASGPATSAPAPVQPIDTVVVEDGAIAVDNTDAGYNDNDAPWYNANCGLNGSHVWTYSTNDPTHSENHAIWRPSLSVAGSYEVKAYIPPCGGEAKTTSARYRITHNGQVAEVTINQQAASGEWVSLGTYDFGSEGAQMVELHDRTDDSMHAVHFDVIAWKLVEEAAPEEPIVRAASAPKQDGTPPSSRIVAIKRQENGYLVQWGGSDDLSGIHSYDVQVRQLPNGGWRTWIVRSGDAESWFGPDEGKHFAFRVRARDKADNEEPWPEEAQMSTDEMSTASLGR